MTVTGEPVERRVDETERDPCTGRLGVGERDQQLAFVNVLVARDLTESLEKFEVSHS